MFICCMTIVCGLKWGVVLVGFHSVGHFSPRRGTPFRYRECAGRRRPLEADMEKKDELWLDLYLVKHVFECLILIYVLYKSDII